MADLAQDRPCIHVCLTGGAAATLYRWVEIGAEEEGVPTRLIEVAETEPVAAAYAAAQSSRFDIGLSLTPERVVLHEMHMPPHQPVLNFETGSEPRPICRLMGGNAARLVVRLPLRFNEPEETPAKAPDPAHRFRFTRSGSKASPSLPAAELGGVAPANAVLVSPAPAGKVQPGLNDSEVRVVARIIARILRERGVL